MSVAKRSAVEAWLRRPDRSVRGILIHGPDRSSVGELAKRVLQAATANPDDPFDVARLGNEEIQAERLAEELNALSLMGGRRVVHIRLTGELGLRERIAAEALGDHVASASADAFLLIESGALSGRGLLRKAAETAEHFLSLPLYEEEAGDLARLARESLEREGLRAPAQVLARLADRLPRDRGGARQTLEALVLFMGPGSGRTLSDSDVDAVFESEGDSAAEIAMFAFSGRRDQTAIALRRARFLGETGPAIIRQLSLHAGRLARVQAAIGSGVAPPTALRSAGVFWKQEKDVMAQLSLWPFSSLDRVRRDLIAADVACKTAGSPDELIAHHAALHITDTATQGAGRP